MLILKKLFKIYLRFKIYLSSNDDKKIQPIDSIEIYAHGKSKDLLCTKEEIKCNNIIKQYKSV